MTIATSAEPPLEPEALERFVETLRGGGIVAAPTETLVGLLGDALDAATVERIVRIKQRPAHLPLAVLVPDLQSVERVAAPLEGRALELARAHWPGPLTLLLRVREGLPAPLSRDGKIGVRVPGPSRALELLRAYGGPLTATSANRSGEPARAGTAELSPELRAEIDAICEGRAPGGLASTLLDVTLEPYRLLRAGAIELALP